MARQIKFNLKFLLIAVCVVGAVLGLMGRLYVETPETFLQILEAFGTVGPFLLAIGTILVVGWFGVRSTPVESVPVCSQCRHKLTTAELSSTCPVCGTDLTAPKMVLLAPMPRRRWGMLIWGVVLFFL